MNRIKYRIWNKRYQRFEYWGHVSKGTFVGVPSGIDKMGIDEACDNSEQFTGLTDKNGKEIYEGDIVYIAGIGNCAIEWEINELSWGFISTETLFFWGYQEILEDIDSLKIVGHIHE